MPLPDRVHVLGQRVTIALAAGLHNEDEGEDHPHAVYGVYDESEQSITLDMDMGHERKRETFLHENLHAMFSAVQIDSVMEHEGGHGMTEHVVSALAPILLDWLRSNKGAVAFLQEVPE